MDHSEYAIQARALGLTCGSDVWRVEDRRTTPATVTGGRFSVTTLAEAIPQKPPVYSDPDDSVARQRLFVTMPAPADNIVRPRTRWKRRSLRCGHGGPDGRRRCAIRTAHLHSRPVVHVRRRANIAEQRRRRYDWVGQNAKGNVDATS